MPPSRPPAPASTAAGSPWWPPRFASWPSEPGSPPDTFRSWSVRSRPRRTRRSWQARRAPRRPGWGPTWRRGGGCVGAHRRDGGRDHDGGPGDLRRHLPAAVCLRAGGGRDDPGVRRGPALRRRLPAGCGGGCRTGRLVQRSAGVDRPVPGCLSRLEMTDWSDDPELLATFQAEVSERLASLQAGLLQLEGHPSPRQLIGGLFRDAHTVKGSARMLGLAPVLQVAHAAEDVLAGLRDGRLAVTPQVVEVLLRAGDCVAANMPGAGEAADELTVDRVVPALAAVLSGQPAAEARAAEAPAAKPPPAGPPLPAVPAPRDHQAATPPEPTPPEPTPPEPTWAGPTRAAADSIRVTATKVYDLLDTVGEAELGARRLQQTTDELRRFCAAHARATVALRGASARADLTLPPAVKSALLHVSEAAEEITAVATTLREVAETHSGRVMDVRDGAMALAMVPVRRVFAALPRLVRDVTAQSGKQVVLELAGGEVELDKHVLEGLADALKHLVTNAIDHGCEPPAQRLAAGKPAAAVIQVMASASGGTVTIEVSDDGRGIDETAVRTAAIARGLLPPDSAATGPALLGLLFTPALSTAATVTETSGRGVGLDVVRTAMEQLGGRADVRTVLGAGCRFTLTLPVTLGVLRCLIARVGRERYAVPVAGITETVSLRDAAVHTLAGSRVLGWHGTTVPLVDP